MIYIIPTLKADRRKISMKSGKIRKKGLGTARQAEETLETYSREWLEWKRPRIKEASYAKYRTVIRKHILPQLGGLRPAALGRETLERFALSLTEEKKLSPKTARDILTVLAAILDFGSQRRGGGTGPKIDMPRLPRKEMRVLSLREQRLFMDYLTREMDECRFAVALALLTGMRIGEICALRWENISIEEGTVRVCATVQRVAAEGGTKLLLGSPKSEASQRTIPLSDRALGLCRAMCPGDGRAFVLTGTERCMEPRTLQYRMKKYTEDCGLYGVHFHTLRHTFATRCVESGFELKSLSEVLGHSSTSITLNRYVHSSMEMKRSNMKKLAAVGL